MSPSSGVSRGSFDYVDVFVMGISVMDNGLARFGILLLFLGYKTSFRNLEGAGRDTAVAALGTKQHCGMRGHDAASPMVARHSVDQLSRCEVSMEYECREQPTSTESMLRKRHAIQKTKAPTSSDEGRTGGQGSNFIAVSTRTL